MFDISYYSDFISKSLAEHLWTQLEPVPGVEELFQLGENKGQETRGALLFLRNLYVNLWPELKKVLDQRTQDRQFIDDRVNICADLNLKERRDFLSSDYLTIIGLKDSNHRIILGPKNSNYAQPGDKKIAPLPEFLKGFHVTLFGPPGSAKMAVNAMNAYHRRLKDEPLIVGQILADQSESPKWGADDEDSKTPLREDLVDAAINLSACFDRTIHVEGSNKYQLAKDHLSLPIKRFPGLALPCTFLYYKKSPIPLHLYDFALHLFHNYQNPEALTFYVPKLENEEEAQYIHKMVSTAEALIKQMHPEYSLGSVRLMVVLENPRAILLAHEIMDALHPYFVGASLGWHDYLASTARIFKEDSNYRIPVKADPNIVIKYIKASHQLLANVIGSRGGIKVGGMYGVLPLENDLWSDSFQMTIFGYIKDVVTQMKRNLDGFWVAHPDFVRIGMALVEAWKIHLKGESQPLKGLVTSLLLKRYHEEILNFIFGDDIESLDIDDPNYVRSLIVADIKESDFIANNDPVEIRYNVFQTLQYLTDWLSGNGCVALPASINDVAVRVMDDLATAERSRWEVWHEINHGRFKLEEFIKIAHEEMHFIRKDLSNSKKIVQVKYTEESSRWYPIAFKLMLKLMCDKKPVEFVTQLLMPFTLKEIREAKDPWEKIVEIDSQKYTLDWEVDRLNSYFEVCGSKRFAREMSKKTIPDLEFAKNLIESFSLEEVKEAAFFHGDIGQSVKTLDSQAAREQSKVIHSAEKNQIALREMGKAYLEKFGFKFLISAMGKSGEEILFNLRDRINRSFDEELSEAKNALFEISKKRLKSPSYHTYEGENSILNTSEFSDFLSSQLNQSGVKGISIAISDNGQIQTIAEGFRDKENPVTDKTAFQIASLSKSMATAFALKVFENKNISIDQSVNRLLNELGSSIQFSGQWASQLYVRHLLNHTGLNMHYVKGFEQKTPPIEELLRGMHGYSPVEIIHPPGKIFCYSGGGFLVLQHILELITGGNVNLQRPQLEMSVGFLDSGLELKAEALNFPLMAAGLWETPAQVAMFLNQLTEAYHNIDGSKEISHDVSVQMLHGENRGSRDFMGVDAGLGVFIAEAGESRWVLHQGANEGFRSLYLHCFSGPDRGKGFVICANGDNKAVPLIGLCAQKLLLHLKCSGIEFSKFSQQFDWSNIDQEQIVNLGYKKLILDTFLPCQPEGIKRDRDKSLNDQNNVLLDAKIDNVTDQRFALAENLISPYPAFFDPDHFCSQGKVMDSWETSRHNSEKFHSLELRLKKRSKIRYVSISTEYHDGNHVEGVELEYLNQSGQWASLLAYLGLKGHSLVKLKLPYAVETDQIKVKAYPDGGLTRLGLYESVESDVDYDGISRRFSHEIPKKKNPECIPYKKAKSAIYHNKDYACLSNGGRVEKVSNEHYGPAEQVISPFEPLHMFDGFESARSRTSGHFEELVIRLGEEIKIDNILFNFKYFVNNCPKSISIYAQKDDQWILIKDQFDVKAYAGNLKKVSIESNDQYQLLKFKIFPDGGINRIRVFGKT